jgi:hypothetical protein
MADYSLCEFTLKELKSIAKDFSIPTTKMKKYDLIILLDRAGYGEDYMYVPPRKPKFQKRVKRVEYEGDDAEEKLKYNLCVDRRNKLYSLSKSQLHQKIKKRNPNFIIPEHLTQQQIIDEIMYLDECYDLVPNNFSSKLEFKPEKIYMKPSAPMEQQSNERLEPKAQSISKTQSKTKNAFLANKDEEQRLQRLSISELLEILYSRQYYPMQLINKLKTREQLINAILMRESDVLKMISKL